MGRNGKRLDKEPIDGLQTAAVERNKLRAAEKKQLEYDYSKMGRSKNLELRTVDIKDLWQVDDPPPCPKTIKSQHNTHCII